MWSLCLWSIERQLHWKITRHPLNTSWSFILYGQIYLEFQIIMNIWCGQKSRSKWDHNSDLSYMSFLYTYVINKLLSQCKKDSSPSFMCHIISRILQNFWRGSTCKNKALACTCEFGFKTNSPISFHWCILSQSWKLFFNQLQPF